MKQFIAYQGSHFAIEWYFNARGKSEAHEYFQSLSLEEKKKVLHLFELMGDFGQIRNEKKFRHEGDQIYAFKPMPHRFLSFFFTGSKIIVTNAFIKKTPKLPPKEKTTALRCCHDYETRVKKGEYYDR